MTLDTMAPTESTTRPRKRRTGPGRPRLSEGRRSTITRREELVRQWCAESDTSLRKAAAMMKLSPQALDHAMKSQNPHARTIHRFVAFFHEHAGKSKDNRAFWKAITIGDLSAEAAVTA